MKKIQGCIKDYNWGNNYFISDLLNLKDKGIKAELWYGTHSLGESKVDDVLLSDYLKNNTKYDKVPFLFKVLAIDTPLSLQCHPDKVQAEREFKLEEKLHKTLDVSQWNFKDDNDKTEMLYPLTNVTALCGFRDFLDIKKDFNLLLEDKASLVLKENIKQTFKSVFDQKDNKEILETFKKNIEIKTKGKEEENGFYTRYGLSKKIMSLYPNDVGLIISYMLNLVCLEKNQAMFIPPTTIHAYTKGNAIEIMSNSDNVLRAGLTSKKIDLDMLLKLGLFEKSTPYKCKQVLVNNIPTLDAPTSVFKLSCLENNKFNIEKDNLYLVFVTSGYALINDQKINKGECVIIDKAFSIDVKGQVFLAR